MQSKEKTISYWLLLFSRIIYVIFLLLVLLIGYYEFRVDGYGCVREILFAVSWIVLIIFFPSFYIYIALYYGFSITFGDFMMDSYFAWVLLFVVPAFIIGYIQWFFLFPFIYHRAHEWIEINLIKSNSMK